MYDDVKAERIVSNTLGKNSGISTLTKDAGLLGPALYRAKTLIYCYMILKQLDELRDLRIELVLCLTGIDDPGVRDRCTL